MKFLSINSELVLSLKLEQRHHDVVLTLGEVELTFLGEPTQSAVHLVNFQLSGLAQILGCEGLLSVIQGVPHETSPISNVLYVHN